MRPICPSRVFRSLRFPFLVFYVICFFITMSAFSYCYADDFEDTLTDIVKDFERHIGNLDENSKYNVVVRSFVDNYTRKTKKLSNEIENSLTDIIVEKFRFRKNIVVLERQRLKAVEEELTFDTDGELTWDKRMFKKLGAGFIITGTFTKMSRYVKIRATMIDIYTGEVVASSNGKVIMEEIDPSLLSDYPAEEKPQQRQQQRQQTTQDDGQFQQPGTYPPENQWQQQPQYDQQTPILAYYCCDGYGVRRCQLFQPVPVGSSCFCIGQGYGIACQ